MRKKPASAPSRSRLSLTPLRILVALASFLLITGLIAFAVIWVHYSRLVDEKLRKGPFTQTAQLYATPEPVSVGDEATIEEIVAALRRRGYTEDRSNRVGWYHVRADGIEIFPGVDAYPHSEPGVIFIENNSVTRIISSRDHTERPRYYLDPELVTNLHDRRREKRRLVRFNDLPKVLVHAVISAEDKRFFEHAGFDPIRILRTAWVDITQNRRYGASTISMQLARLLWLSRDKTWKRKALEALITLQLEQKLTKEQIFEYYANQVDLGQRKSFAIHGFGEAAQVYFGKDVRDLRLEEAALLAGLIQRPNYLNPYRHPERAIQRRNIVLGLMRENGYITELQYMEAVKAPLKLAEGGEESSDAPYFVDLAYDELQDNFSELDFQANSYRIYTTLDMKLQRDALEAVQIGIREVDAQLAKMRRKYPEPQVALVCIDPHTAEVKALIGGRSYAASQLNRALARRQPGSAFKPFVYAAALNTALEGRDPVITPVTQVVDEPTTFYYEDREYTPNNFRQQFNGPVTLRFALAKSLNIPTVKFAEMAGYQAVAELAEAAGLKGVKPTPALALGAYEVTPLDIASAYTVFSNEGTWVQRNLIREIRSADGSLIHQYQPVTRQVLDPRIAYMIVNLMEEVLRSGTGAGVRSRGFLLPAAGKTGTSHDAWFAGFTSKLLCVVWVGFDDNQELPLEGAKAALPIWTEFMKRAHRHREYRGVQPFSPPDGVAIVDIDPQTGQLATAACPKTLSEVFIAGTQPVELCRLHGGGGRTIISSWESDPPPQPHRPPLPPSAGAPADRASVQPQQRPAATQPQPAPQPEQKRGFWGRIRAIFR
ncbi:MAG: PBP1A family penicillin-binding protein [Bryobacteraceae bacterium]|nr:PBP1A family penicillin-binding protein [Bryobacteraceae bacterium]